jgi:hypothetical protein
MAATGIAFLAMAEPICPRRGYNNRIALSDKMTFQLSKCTVVPPSASFEVVHCR